MTRKNSSYSESVLSRRAALAKLGLSVAAVYSAPAVLGLERQASAKGKPEKAAREKMEKGAKSKGEKARSKLENQKKGWAKKGYGKSKRNK